ncbi:MAG: hypothetical protein A3B68_00355 [Candidatus Melainabacteria bacterium RIFCSPHIGHO2_02_FULL_34_12]|nr:MAG: hypothetical protein A3B68_00355 [Candidatus Melainabacteria bacterium RIFCSPHIGHO2_02_FULL_34_12]
MKRIYKNNNFKALLSLFVLVLLVINSLNFPAYAQSGFSNIGSFFNKEKHKPDSDEIDFDKATTIKEILVEGNRLIPEEHILSTIDSKVGSKFDKDKVLSDLEALDNLGYFVRDSIQASPEQTDNGVLLKIRIEENNPIAKVQILGNEILHTEDLLLVVQDLIGKPESIKKISETLDTIEKLYQEKGYVLARITDIALDPDGTLIVKLNEGIIEKINITGNSKTKEKYIRRFIPNLSPDEPYNEILLVQDFRALQGTGLFNDIKRNIKPSAQNPDKYELTVEVDEKRTTSFGFGGGVNTLNGVYANVGFSNNNLFGEGKSISLNTQVGTGVLANTFNSLVNQNYLADKKTIQAEVKYTDPNFLGTKNSATFFTHGYTFNSYLVDLAQERNFSIGTSFSRPLGMNLFAGLDLNGESVTIREFNSSATDFLAEQLLDVDNAKYLDDITEKTAFKPGQSLSGHDEAIKKHAAGELAKEIRKDQLTGGNYINFSPSIAFDTRDNPMDPKSGWNNRLSVGQAVGIGNSSFTKLGIDLRRYIPIGKKDTLAFNIQGASSVIGDIPMYNQFKAGGFYGVRGYRTFSDLGIGARSLLTSIEYRTPLLDTIPGFKNTPIGQNLKLAFFSDFGYVGGNQSVNRLYNRLNTAFSTGLGVRANIPMLGAIRIDYGIPWIKPLWNNRNILGRFNFGLGERF